MLLAPLVLGGPALGWSAYAPRGPDAGIERAFAVALLVWLITGVVLYTVMARLHPRYTEGFTPAVAAAAGVGAAWALRDGVWERVALVVGALALALYGDYLLGASDGTWRVLAAGAVLAAAAASIGGTRVRVPLAAAGLAV